ncbi:hypothetical protein ACGFYP_34080 [Streptomyces sp. NPDC048370]|uniref:hypothetical protein n=1 Tax=Streptomyces sp. NPDC048370 TaxID=3365540 RepID=UPI00371947BD
MAGSSELWSRWGEFGKYNARGMKGGEALILELNRIVYSSGIVSPVTSDRGLSARLRYLDSAAGRDALKDQGVTPRTIKSWMRGKSKPSKANLERVDNAYWERRRANLIRSGWLKRHLDNDGRGRRMEIYPVDQAQVDEKRRRPDLSERSITVRYIWADHVRSLRTLAPGSLFRRIRHQLLKISFRQGFDGPEDLGPCYRSDDEQVRNGKMRAIRIQLIIEFLNQASPVVDRKFEGSIPCTYDHSHQIAFGLGLSLIAIEIIGKSDVVRHQVHPPPPHLHRIFDSSSAYLAGVRFAPGAGTIS